MRQSHPIPHGVAAAAVLYSGAEIALLEDIFAAVDGNTSRLLWATLCQMHAAGTTIVLVTNQARLFGLPEVGKICLLSNGRMAAIGRFIDIRAQLEAHGLLVVDRHPSAPAAAPVAAPAASRPPPTMTTAAAVAAVDDTPLLSLSAAVALVRRTLRRSEGEVVKGGLIERACAALTGSGGFGLDEQKREGLIAWADFAVYLKDFGSPSTRVLLLVSAGDALAPAHDRTATFAARVSLRVPLAACDPARSS